MVKFNFKNIFLLSILFFIILYLRRSDQLIHPDVWTEDGAFNVYSYIQHGWLNLLEPVRGYLITMAKLITDLSMSISFVYYPEISTYLAWLFTIIVSLIIIYSPTKLPYKVLSAIVIYMVPTNGEVYGLPLFSFWFAGLFILLALLWEPNKKQILKNFLLTLGGLSSPLIIVAIPIQIYRLYIFKNKKVELITLVLMIAISLLQIYMMKSHQIIVDNSSDMLLLLKNININSYSTFIFGKYYLSSFVVLDYHRWIISDPKILLIGGYFLITIIIISFWFLKKDPYFIILIYLLLATIAISLYRADFQVLRMAPRHFFYIYIVLSWILLYIIKELEFMRYIVVPILILSFISSLKIFPKHSQYLNWRKEISQCANDKGGYTLPIHFAGSKEATWHITLESETCKKLIENSLIGSNLLKGKK